MVSLGTTTLCILTMLTIIVIFNNKHQSVNGDIVNELITAFYLVPLLTVLLLVAVALTPITLIRKLINKVRA